MNFAYTTLKLFLFSMRTTNPLFEILQFALIALIIVVPIRTFIAQPFIVSGASMEDTFHSGEYLIVDQASYYFSKPERGDVIIFKYPRDTSKFFIKRIIALPGDTIKIENGKVTLYTDEYESGIVLEEPYVKSMEASVNIEETLEDGEYFVMGDNRDQSSDSRIWGTLQEEHIVGRALVRLFPLHELNVFPGKQSLSGTPITLEMVSP